MGLKLANNAISRLAAGIASGDLSLSVTPGDGLLFPSLSASDFFPATLVRASDGAIEIIKVTARSTDVLTIERAQEGTTALAFIAGDRVELRMTSGSLGENFLSKSDVAFTGDADSLTTPGMYRVGSAATNIPVAADGAISVAVSGSGTLQIYMRAPATALTQMYIRSIGSGAWTSWVKMTDDTHNHDVQYAPRRPGDVFVHAGTSAPAGSLVVPTAPANVSRTTYADLFAAIGTTWGAGDGSTTFGLPWVAADNAILQASGNVGTSTVGEVLSHNHTQNAHTHAQNAHTHIQNAHTHADGFQQQSGNTSAYPYAAATSGGYQTTAGYGLTNVGNATAVNQNATATNQNTTATNNATGGSANVAAGARFLLCVQY